MQGGEESRLGGREVAKLRYKEILGNSKDYDMLCQNQSELKHMHAIRPYCSKEQQRKSTRRQHQSPYQMTRSNSKRLDSSSRKSEEKSKRLAQAPSGGRQMNEMLGELINLKSEYKMLKANYSKVFSEKKEEVQRQQELRKGLEEELEKKAKQVERAQKSAALLQQEIDRIRKECSRVLELQRFKIKKLEQTLQEKELMIAYLRNELECIKRGPNEPPPNPSLFFLQNSTPMLNFSYLPKPSNLSVLSAIPAQQARPSFPPEDDSLSFSRDKSKETDSIIHSFLSNDHSAHHNFFKKEALIQSLQESPIVPEIEPIEETSEPSEKEVMDFKKRKEIVIAELALESKGKVRPNHKKLQILIADENQDTQNIPGQSLREELSMDTRKKMTNNSSLICKQKKKLTAKKVRPF